MKAQPAHFALLAALLAGFSAHAVTESVTFDDALTNRTDETKWEYRDVARTTKGEYYFKKEGATIESMEYAFAITSVVVEAKTTSVASDPRQLLIDAVDSKLDVATQSTRPSTVGKTEYLRFEFDFASAVKSFKLSATSGKSGYIYLYSAEISGCNICPQPQNVEARELQGTRFTLSWENGEGVVSDRVDMLEVRRVPEQGELADRYDFEDFVGNKTSAKGLTEDDYANYPCFTNSVNLFVADGTNGVLQISNTSKHGVLVYEGPGTVGETTLFLRARKHPKDTVTKRTMSIGWTVDGVKTNLFPDVTLAGSDFSAFCIPLTNMNDNATLAIQSKDAAVDGRRIQIDEMTFVRDYAEAYVATNALPPVVTSQSGLRLRGLATKALYIATVTAYDEEGNPSEPAGPIEVRTKACNPETLILIR